VFVVDPILNLIGNQTHGQTNRPELPPLRAFPSWILWRERNLTLLKKPFESVTQNEIVSSVTRNEIHGGILVLRKKLPHIFYQSYETIKYVRKTVSADW